MNIHKIVDEINNMIAVSQFNSSDVGMLKMIIKDIESSMCFDLGNYDFISDFIVNDKLSISNSIELPNDKILCKFDVNSDAHYVLMVRIHETICFFLFNESDSGIGISMAMSRWNKDDCFNHDYLLKYHHEQQAELSEAGLKSNLSSIAIALKYIEIINCSNIELVNNIPSKLKQDRAKKKGKKLFEYKTLHIKQNTKRNINKSEGKHTSPRVHLRRGHIRKCHSGITTWVQPCVVGDKEKGMIHKDYKLDKVA